MLSAINVLSLGVRKYNASLISKPYRTKMITAGFIFGFADAFCQKIFEKPSTKPFDYKRCLNMIIYGTFMSAPLSHLWYCKWASAICSRVSTKAKLQPYLCMIADQILYTPVSLSVFLFATEYMREFRSLKALNNIKEKLWSGTVASWKTWPPIVLANFMLIPVPWRVLFINLFGFFWTIYLSHLQNN